MSSQPALSNSQSAAGSDSENDMYCHLSDTEAQSMNAELGAQGGQLYWFGQRFFEFILAQSLLHTSREFNSASDLDARMRAMDRGFAYADELETLRQHVSVPIDGDLVHGCVDTRQAYLTAVGLVQKRGNLVDRKFLVKSLQGCPAPEAPSEVDGPKLSSVASEGWQRKSGSRSMPGTIKSLPMWIMALQEYGGQNGEPPEYTDGETLSLNPPEHSMRLLFKGQEFEASAQSRKAAKGLLAQQACRAFGIKA